MDTSLKKFLQMLKFKKLLVQKKLDSQLISETTYRGANLHTLIYQDRLSKHLAQNRIKTTQPLSRKK